MPCSLLSLPDDLLSRIEEHTAVLHNGFTCVISRFSQSETYVSVAMNVDDHAMGKRVCDAILQVLCATYHTSPMNIEKACVRIVEADHHLIDGYALRSALEAGLAQRHLPPCNAMWGKNVFAFGCRVKDASFPQVCRKFRELAHQKDDR